MPLPRKVHVGALTYRVTDDRSTLLETCRAESIDVVGHTDHNRALIVLDATQAPCQRRDSLLHEVLHTIAETTGLAFEWGTEREEQIVRRLAPVVLAVLRANPQLVAYLTDTDDG